MLTLALHVAIEDTRDPDFAVSTSSENLSE
jgi:hypothetical protein